MLYNPINQKIFTNNGAFVKQLHCPVITDELILIKESGGKHFQCSKCNHKIFDTSQLNDEDLTTLIKGNANACLLLNLDQPNVIIIPKDPQL